MASLSPTYNYTNYDYYDENDENYQEEFETNEKINIIKNKEYKNLTNLYKPNNNINVTHHQTHNSNHSHPHSQAYSQNIRCLTEPYTDEVVSTTSFGSNDFRLNSQPFFPKSHNKQQSINYYNNYFEDECE